ncbi:hypothetical protein MTO96_032427 [Rhipicephalus appendiculatus]
MKVPCLKRLTKICFKARRNFHHSAGSVQKTDEGFNIGQEKLHLKGGQEVREAGITSNVNLWGWNQGHRGSGSSVSKKMDKDLYRGVNQFSHLGYRSPKGGGGSELRQQEVGFTGTYSGHGRGVSRRDRFWDLNNHQPSLASSASQQTGSNLYQGTGGLYCASFKWKTVNFLFRVPILPQTTNNERAHVLKVKGGNKAILTRQNLVRLCGCKAISHLQEFRSIGEQRLLVLFLVAQSNSQRAQASQAVAGKFLKITQRNLLLSNGRNKTSTSQEFRISGVQQPLFLSLRPQLDLLTNNH